MVYVKICLTNWVAINLKTHLWGSKSDQFCQFWRLKKVDGSRFFWSIFDFIDPKSELYGFIEKQAPQKALCLGPDPPLAKSRNLSKIHDFYRFWGLQ
jgi:hypothetical protein